MTFNVRIFGYRGTAQIPVTHQRQFQADSVQVLSEPYEFGQVLASNGAAAVTSATDAGLQTKILRVEVPDGAAIRYEIVLPGAAAPRTPGNGSPILSGNQQFEFGPGWLFKFVDAANFP